jgi:hypothetical protein
VKAGFHGFFLFIKTDSMSALLHRIPSELEPSSSLLLAFQPAQ